jgi:hypothetical protein
LRSACGYYLGTRDPEDGSPLSRESFEYWHRKEGAASALKTRSWTQMKPGSSGFRLADSPATKRTGVAAPIMTN